MTEELITAVHALTRARLGPNPQTDYPNVLRPVTQPPLLVELENAIRGTMGRDAASKVANAAERSILDPDALFEFMKIASAIRSWCRAVGVRPSRVAVADLEAWHANYVGAGGFFLATLQDWERTILAFLDPVKQIELTEPCPTCESSAWQNEAGEWKPRPVVVSYRRSNPLGTSGGWCRVESCGAVWENLAAIRLLRAQIGSDPNVLLAFLLNTR